MHFIYTISLRLYYLALWIASGFNPKAKAWIQGRRGWKKDLRDKIEKIRNDRDGHNERSDIMVVTSERSERNQDLILVPLRIAWRV